MTTPKHIADGLSEATEALLTLLLEGDHSRGCEGRCYSCKCEYDDQVYFAAKAVRAALGEGE